MIPVEPEIVEEIIALEDAVMLEHPPVLFRDERLEHRRTKFGMIVRGQRVADIVQQRADDIFLVHAVAVRQRRRLQRMLHAVDREAAAIAFEQLQMRQHPVGQIPG